MVNVPIYLAGSSGFDSLKETYNVRLPHTPAVIVVPTEVSHIQEAVKCAAHHNVSVQAKSGGHSYASFSTGGADGAMVITLENFQTIDLDPDTNVVTVGGGVRLGNLALGIHSDGNRRALSHGTCPGVGVGGHITHGGFGFSSRAWGLAMDAIIAMDVVLADGSQVHCSTDENPDLFWAMRGAAENFGIITTFYMQTQEAPETVIFFTVALGNPSPSDGAAYFSQFQDFVQNETIVDRNLGIQMYMDRYSMSFSGTYFGSFSDFDAKIKPELMHGLSSAVELAATEYSWIDSLVHLGGGDTLQIPTHGYDEHDNFYAKSLTIPSTISVDALIAYFEFARGSGMEPSVNWFSIISLYGGPDSQIPALSGDAGGAYSHRDALWVVQHYGFVRQDVPYPTSGLAYIDDLNAVIPSTMPGTEFGGYINYIDPSLSRDEAHEQYYGDVLSTRLREFKTKVDPLNVFSNPQSFIPA